MCERVQPGGAVGYRKYPEARADEERHRDADRTGIERERRYEQYHKRGQKFRFKQQPFPEGQLFRQYAVRVLDLVAKSTEEVKEIHSGLHGTLYLASVEGHAPKLFAKWIAGFQRENPRV